MALYRQLQLSFWRDGFIMDLTPEEKFFYVYLLQCSNTKQCGIFELPKRAIEYETGYNRETIDKLLERFIKYGKIIYCEKTKEIMIVNWIKYNFINSRNTIMCINKELKEVKNREFVDKFYEMCEKLGYPLSEIFKDIDGFQEKIRGLQGACKDLGEEEIKEVEEIKKEIKEEIKKEVVEEEEEKLKDQLMSADSAEEASEMAKVVEVMEVEITKFFNIEAEINILGAIFRDNSALCDILDFLDSDDFYNAKHKLIYNAAVKLYGEGKSIDVVSLCEKLGTSLQEVGGVSYLSELYSSALPSSKVIYYGEIIKEKANLRRLMVLLEAHKEEIQNKDKNCDEIVDSLESAFLKLKKGNNLQESSTQDGIAQVLDMLEERYRNGGEIQGISTGYRVIDKMLGGFNKEEFIILAARPSMGKTAMALNLALNTTINEKAKVAFFNLEMGKKQIIERAFSALGKIECNNIKNGSLSDEEWGKVVKVSCSLANSSLYIYDKVFSLRGIKSECKRLKIQKGLDVVIIDYLQLINSEERAESRNLDISKISRELKLLAKELDITVVALSQLSRAPEARLNHRPMLSDLRESGSLEQDADVVMFLYRDAYYNRNTEDKDIIENIIAKNRNGQVGIVKLKWLPQYQLVE